jgi:hypothetical protein
MFLLEFRRRLSLEDRAPLLELARNFGEPEASDPKARLGHVPESESLWEAGHLVNQSFLSLRQRSHMIPPLVALVESFQISDIEEATRHARPRPLF